jgi:hypothetical protein
MGLSLGRRLPVCVVAVSPTSLGTWLWCGDVTPLACSRRPLVFKLLIRDLAGSRALIILRLICTADGRPRLGSAAWVSLHFLGPCAGAA